MFSSHQTSTGRSRTLQRIPTSQLRPGMFLVRVLDSWWKSPFFIHRRLLKTASEVQELMSSGIREVEIDLSLGTEESLESEVLINHNQISPDDHDADDSQEGRANEPSPRSPVLKSSIDSTEFPEDFQDRGQVERLREATIAALEGAFEGVKTGQPISESIVEAAAQALVQKTLANPGLVAEIVLIDSLKLIDKSLYAHVVDTAVYSILVGLQLGWNVETLEGLGVAGLLHDVGYMRLPQNVVKAHWEGRGDPVLLQKHVVMGEALLQRHEQFSGDIVRMVHEHHAYRDGSGYPDGQGGAQLSDQGQVLGIVDYFDEMLTKGGPSGSLPAALAIRRLYQDAQKGKFSIPFIEAMIRILGVFPVGTMLQLSTGEYAVVLKQHAEMGLKPRVKIFWDADGNTLDVPKVLDLSQGDNFGHEITITKVLDPSDYSLNLQELVIS